MLGELVVELVFWLVVEVLWRGVKLVARGVYRLVTLPLALVGGGGDGDESE